MTDRICVKCPSVGILAALDVTKAIYCRPCYMQMIRHKFASALGRQRVFRDGESKSTLVHYDGTPSAAFLLGMIRCGLSADVRKRLQLQPTICVLISRIDHNDIAECIAYTRRIETESGIDCKWIVCHLAYAFADKSTSVANGGGFDHVDQLRRLIDPITDPTARIELIDLLTSAVLIRIADELHMTKVMRATSADRMSRSILDAIASGRGESIADLSAIVDKRHARVQLLRPMKDISDKEIGIFNRFEHLDHLAIIIDHPSAIDQRSIQSTTSAFIDELQSHFPATISTILSTARKVVRKPTTTSAPSMSTRCRLCFVPIDDAIYCICCERLFNEYIPDRTLLPDMFVCCDQ